VPDAERCRKASREGTSRVFEAKGGDKPGLQPIAGIGSRSLLQPNTSSAEVESGTRHAIDVVAASTLNS